MEKGIMLSPPSITKGGEKVPFTRNSWVSISVKGEPNTLYRVYYTYQLTIGEATEPPTDKLPAYNVREFYIGAPLDLNGIVMFDQALLKIGDNELNHGLAVSKSEIAISQSPKPITTGAIFWVEKFVES